MNGKLEPVSWSRGARGGRGEVQRGEGARRQVRRHRLHPHDQRRELLPAEVRPRRARHQQHRSSPHRRRRHAARRAERQDRTRWRPSDDLYTAKAALVIGADLAQQHPLLAFQLRANYRHHQRPRLRRDPRPGARGPVRRKQSSAHRRARNSRQSSRCADELKRARELVIVFGDVDPGRGRPPAGRVRRFARHPGEVRLPGRLLEFARRHGHGPAAGLGCRATSAARQARA